MSHMMQPQIVLLKEGTDQSQGKGQLISNINACEAVCEILRTTLGPRGMDKLIHSGKRITMLKVYKAFARKLTRVATTLDVCNYCERV
jgi:hypothetical protein